MFLASVCDQLTESTNTSVGLVFVDNSFLGKLLDEFGCLWKECFQRFCIILLGSTAHLFDDATHLAFVVLVMSFSFDVLAMSLHRVLMCCHDGLLGKYVRN